jgi:hypothetical protein
LRRTNKKAPSGEAPPGAGLATPAVRSLIILVSQIDLSSCHRSGTAIPIAVTDHLIFLTVLTAIGLQKVRCVMDLSMANTLSRRAPQYSPDRAAEESGTREDINFATN